MSALEIVLLVALPLASAVAGFFGYQKGFEDASESALRLLEDTIDAYAASETEGEVIA
jgi:hypothetical protein